MAKEKKEKVHEFITHKYSCKQCISIDVDKPSTLSNCCLTGAPLLRDYLVTLSAPAQRKKSQAIKRLFTQEADGKNYQTTRQKIKEVIKYK